LSWNQLCLPKPEFTYDLFKAAALIPAHAMGFKLCICFACKEFHLAFEMPLPRALWQPVTALPIWFLAPHTALSEDPVCELIRRVFLPFQEKRKTGLPPLPAGKTQKLETYFAKV
jgi:hypothetical protein